MKKPNRGFLLIEVLLTVTIVSVSIIFINHAFSASLKALSLADSYQKAFLFIDDRVFDLELAVYARDVSSFSKQEDAFGMVFSWNQEVRPLEKKDLDNGYEASGLDLGRLNCSLRWGKAGERKAEFCTYIPLSPAP
jgi:hypothetical protein